MGQWSRSISAVTQPQLPQPAEPDLCSRSPASYDARHALDVDSLSVSALLFAHQGGWDEVLFVLVPILIFAALLAIANRRASRQQDDAPPGEPIDPT